ncbi:MAG: AEC family transporter [Myxococcota bacterium]
MALPALVLVRLHGVHLGADAILPVSMAWLQLAGVAAAVEAIGALAGWDRPTRAALTLTAGLANTSFVGYPLIEALVGPEGLPTAILCDQLGSFLALATVGAVIAARASGRAPSVGALAGRVARFPALWALALALLAPPLPDVLAEALERLGATLTPLALMSVGLQLQGARGATAPLVVGLGLKLAVVPAALLGLYLALGVAPGLDLTVTVLEAAMAPMITGAILAADHGLAPGLANRMVGVGIPLSMATVPLWAAVLRTSG